MYKLIALDMDGTLLKDDKTISKASLDAIKKAREKGIKVVLTTGRPMAGIKNYLETLNMYTEDDYAITFNGALIRKTKSGEIINQELMSYDDLIYLYNLSKKLSVNIHAFDGDVCITPKLSRCTDVEVKANKINYEIVNFYDLKNRNLKIAKTMFVDEPDILENAIKKIPEYIYEKYSILRSAPIFLEFLKKGVTKGEGVRMLSEKLGIRREEVICIGDEGNDVAMIKYAGLGVAMENATDEAKKNANFITKTNENDGVAYVIKKFALN